MSHIAEGLLHAHLDGALGPAERERWADAEAHLALCEDCRRRLEEAREIRDAAAALLAGAAVPQADRPSFDALAAEAGRRATGVAEVSDASDVDRFRYESPRRWWSSPAKLAWAASLVLAVGAGWVGRQLLVEEGGDVPLLMESRAEALEDAATTDDGARVGRMEPPPAGAAAADEAAPEERETVTLAPQALARRAPDGPCYEIQPRERPAGVLRLRPDGTAALHRDGRPLVGFWERPSADSVAARLTDGEDWMELRLGSDDLERTSRDCPAD